MSYEIYCTRNFVVNAREYSRYSTGFFVSLIPSVAPESDVPFMDDRAREAAKRVVFLTVFLDLLGFGIVIPLLGVYSTQFGASPALAGLLAATYSMMGFLFAPFWGRLSDRIGRRPVLLYSIFGTGVGYLFFAFAHLVPAIALGMLFLSRIVDGITSGNISTAQAYLSDITTPENRAKAFGMFGAIFGIGFAIGPSVGALIMWLPSALGLPGVLGTNFGLGLFTASLAFFNWALAWKRLPETLSPEIRRANREKDAAHGARRPIINVHGFRQALRIPGLRLLITLSFFITAAFAMPLQGTYSLFLITKYTRPQVQDSIKQNPQAAIDEARKEIGKPQPVDNSGGEGAPAATAIEKTDNGDIAPYPATMGGDFTLDKPSPPDLSWRHIEKLLVARLASTQSSLIFAAIGLTAMIVQGGMIGFIRKKIGEVNMIIVGTVIMVISLALIPFPKSLYGEMPIMALLAAGNSIAAPVLTSLVTALSPENERGELIGVFQSVQSLGRIIGPIVGGGLFNYFSPNAPYWAGAIVMALTFFIALQLRGVKTEETPVTA
jgi:DHA1 family tetracycline resistance protein-like MFS transporter